MAEERKSRKNLADEFTGRIIGQLKEGAAPWQKPWKAGEFHRPFNYASEKNYRGANVAILAGRGLADPRWLTYKQARDEGWQVKKGANAEHVVYWQWQKEQTRLDEDGRPVLDDEGQELKETVDLARPRMYAYNVFPLSQIQDEKGRDIPAFEAKAPDWNPHERAEAIIQAAGVAITHDQLDRAFYNHAEDAIHLPPKENFPDVGEYYSTVLHELGHSLGHRSRLNWASGRAPFGSPEYAKEELRVEIGSWMLCQELGLPHNPEQHVSYADSWIKALENDHYEIMRACQTAEKIRDNILDVELGHALGKDTEKSEPNLFSGHEAAVSDKKIYLDVPYKEKDQAKALGATWDNGQKSWCARPGVDLAPLAGWMPEAAKAELAGILPAREAAPGASPEPQIVAISRSYYCKAEGEGLDMDWRQVKAQKITSAKREAALNEQGGDPEHKIVLGIGESRTNSEGVVFTTYISIAERAMAGGKWQTLPGVDLEALGALPREEILANDTVDLQLNSSENTVDKAVSMEITKELATEKTFLDVPFREKEEAKALGAKWDRNAGLWYAPEGTDLAPLAKFIPEKDLAPVKSISPEAEFAEALEKAGLKISGMPVIDGQIHRVPSMDGKPGNRDGAYCAYPDGRPAGWMMNYRTGGEKIKWVSSGQTLTAAQKAELAQEGEKRRAEREIERQKTQEAAIQKAGEKLQNSLEAYIHPYLDEKALAGLKGLKVEKQYNLMVPGYDTDGNLKTIQTINDKGGKFFESGCPKAGAMHIVGREGGKDIQEALKEPEFYICEGYATGASVHMASPGVSTVVAFDANNLKAVAMAIREVNPTAKITICADNDHKNDKNVGLEKAHEAARAVGGNVLAPEFTPEEKALGLTDFNDLHQARGLGAVRSFLNKGQAEALGMDKPQAQGQVKAAVSPPAPPKAVGMGR